MAEVTRTGSTAHEAASYIGGVMQGTCDALGEPTLLGERVAVDFNEQWSAFGISGFLLSFKV